jgi:hypothetical protein
MGGARTVRAMAKVAGVALAATAGLTVGLAVGPASASTQIQACQTVGHASGTISEFTLYDNAGAGGACVTFYRYGNCTASTTDVEDLYNLAGWGWDNRANAVHTYGTCNVSLYDSRDCPRGGAHTGWIELDNDLATWSNRATCLIVS